MPIGVATVRQTLPLRISRSRMVGAGRRSEPVDLPAVREDPVVHHPAIARTEASVDDRPDGDDAQEPMDPELDDTRASSRAVHGHGLHAQRRAEPQPEDTTDYEE